MVAFSLFVAGFGILMAPLGWNILGAIIGSVLAFTLLLDLLKRIVAQVERHI
jgi:predicted permease